MFIPLFVEEGDYLKLHKRDEHKALRVRLAEIDQETWEVTLHHVDENGVKMGEDETTLPALGRYILESDHLEYDELVPERDVTISTDKFDE